MNKYFFLVLAIFIGFSKAYADEEPATHGILAINGVQYEMALKKVKILNCKEDQKEISLTYFIAKTTEGPMAEAFCKITSDKNLDLCKNNYIFGSENIQKFVTSLAGGALDPDCRPFRQACVEDCIKGGSESLFCHEVCLQRKR